MRIFEHVEGDQFRLHHERIPELGVPLTMIHEALTANFELLEATDPDGGRATDESHRVYFVYRRRAPPVVIKVPSPGPGAASSPGPLDEHAQRAARVTTLRTDVVFGTAERPR